MRGLSPSTAWFVAGSIYGVAFSALAAQYDGWSYVWRMVMAACISAASVIVLQRLGLVRETE